ncbi:MAG: OmpA family protein [Desulfobacterales bacterium]|nr:OmpA family protein [Desulfobacterales bacterium]
MTCDTGIYRVRHISGNKAFYEQFQPIAAYEQQDMTEKIRNEFVTDYPVFNRRTPLADMLRQLDEQELGEMNGEITIVLISDGRESFYNLRNDEQGRVKGPLTEIRRLKEKYSDNLIFHTIFLEKEDTGSKDQEHEGETLLKRMAETGKGENLSGRKLLGDTSVLEEFCSLLCKKEEPIQVRKTAEPKPEPVPVKPEPEPEPEPVSEPKPEPEPEKVPPVIVKSEAPADTDGDGVYDNDDKCPGTPLGAKVNKFGCWVLQGVLFDFDKRNIKPEFYSDLDEVVEILKKNPELKIEIEGHTDNKGTAAHNKILSEKRAGSVREYLVKKGIEPERLSSSGYGFSRPADTNATSEGRALNRRVELKPVQ